MKYATKVVEHLNTAPMELAYVYVKTPDKGGTRGDNYTITMFPTDAEIQDFEIRMNLLLRKYLEENPTHASLERRPLPFSIDKASGRKKLVARMKSSFTKAGQVKEMKPVVYDASGAVIAPENIPMIFSGSTGVCLLSLEVTDKASLGVVVRLRGLQIATLAESVKKAPGMPAIANGYDAGHQGGISDMPMSMPAIGATQSPVKQAPVAVEDVTFSNTPVTYSNDEEEFDDF